MVSTSAASSTVAHSSGARGFEALASATRRSPSARSASLTGDSGGSVKGSGSGSLGRRVPLQHVGHSTCIPGSGDSTVPRSWQVAQTRARGGLEVGLFSRSEEHPSELQSLMRISYAVFCLKKKKNTIDNK